MKAYWERIYNGVVKENPAFILMLGMCPTLAVTTSAINGLGMGLSSLVVLAISNVVISLLRKAIPDEVRLPAYIVIVASFVTVVELLMEAYMESLYAALGIYIPLIVVNCIIFARAESFASKNSPLPSVVDGLGMGLGFTCSLTILSAIRELVGAGTLLGFPVLGSAYPGILLFILAPGGYLTLGLTLVAFNAVMGKIDARRRAKAAAAEGSVA